MPPVLAGHRLRLRPPTEADLPFLLALANDPVLPGYPRFAPPKTEGQGRGWPACRWVLRGGCVGVDVS